MKKDQMSFLEILKLPTTKWLIMNCVKIFLVIEIIAWGVVFMECNNLRYIWEYERDIIFNVGMWGVGIFLLLVIAATSD